MLKPADIAYGRSYREYFLFFYKNRIFCMFRRYKVWYDRAKAKGKLNREGVLMSLGVKIIIVVCDNKKESGGVREG